AVDEAADHLDPAVAEPVGQRAAQRGGLHLLRRPLHVGTRLRAVHDAAARVLGRAERALAGPAGALLAVRLLAAAAHLAACPGGPPPAAPPRPGGSAARSPWRRRSRRGVPPSFSQRLSR